MKTAQAIPSLKHLKPQAPKRRPAGAKASGGRSLLFGVSLKFGLWCFGVLIWSLSAASQEITLSIMPSVHVTWPTITNEAYQVEVSTNLPGNWTPVGDLIEGTGGTVGAWFEQTFPQEFFMVQQTGASGINWLEGVWQGTTYQASSNSVPFTTQVSISNGSRGFSAVFSNNTFNCTATFQLLSYSDTEARFYSQIQSGPCLSGAVVVTRINPTNALYNWYYPAGPTLASAFAVLTKR